MIDLIVIQTLKKKLPASLPIWKKKKNTESTHVHKRRNNFLKIIFFNLSLRFSKNKR